MFTSLLLFLLIAFIPNYSEDWKTMAIVMDKVFEKLVNNSLKFNVFRVKKLGLIEVPERDWGKFYSGDCYLIFDNRYGATHIFYWIGAKSSQDEQAVAAIKAVELDNLFQGVPVQYREVEGHESQKFKKLFDGGIVTLKGGFDAGLQRIQKKEHVPKLFQVKGSKVTVMREVELSWSSMNHGDTFVLDSGTIIFIWSGSSSAHAEKIAAAHLANKLKDKLGEEIVFVADGAEEDLTEDELQVWDKLLNLADRNLVQEPQSDSVVTRIVEEEISLYKCSDFNGKLEVDLIRTGNLEKCLLVGDDSFIVDAGSLGVWIWVGRNSNENERSAAMQTGLKFIELKQLSEKTNVIKVFMGGEPEEFKSLFTTW